MSAAAAETFLEELFELCVEDGVDNGIEGAVDVTKPGDGAHQPGGGDAFQAHTFYRVGNKEWSPAEQKAT